MMPKLMGAVTSVSELCKEIAIARRAKPTDDLTSALVNAEIDGETLSDQTVTIRDRDSLEQTRVKLDDVVSELTSRLR